MNKMEILGYDFFATNKMEIISYYFDGYSGSHSSNHIFTSKIDRKTKMIYETYFSNEAITPEKIEMWNSRKFPILSVAILCHDFEYASLLIDHGIDTKIRDSLSHDALYYTVVTMYHIRDDLSKESPDNKSEKSVRDDPDYKNNDNDIEDEYSYIKGIDLEDEKHDEKYLICKKLFKRIADLQTPDDLNRMDRSGRTLLNFIYNYAYIKLCKFECIEYILEKGATFGSKRAVLRIQMYHISLFFHKKYYQLLLDNLTNEQIESRDRHGYSDFLDGIPSRSEKVKKWIEHYFTKRGIDLSLSFLKILRDYRPRKQSKKERLLYCLHFPTFNPFKIDSECQRRGMNMVTEGNDMEDVFHLYQKIKSEHIKKTRALLFAWAFKHKL
jgi:hypothetical protein